MHGSAHYPTANRMGASPCGSRKAASGRSNGIRSTPLTVVWNLRFKIEVEAASALAFSWSICDWRSSSITPLGASVISVRISVPSCS